MKHKIFVATLLCATPSAANARDWPNAGGWTVAQSDQSCGMMQEYEGKGETELILFITVDGKVGVSIKNADWSAVEGQKYDLDYTLNGASYGGGAAVGITANYKKGFLATFGDDFARDFAAGTSLSIHRGDILVDKLDLDGTAAGVSMVRRCVEALKAEKEAARREEQRLAHIADDPFAITQTDEERRRFGPHEPIPRTSASNWLTAADYPARAQREGRSGVVEYALSVAADGLVQNCQVTKSSGHADLDEATCRIIQRRARFTNGPGKFESKADWSLAE